jgi:hypothetical protein
MLRLKASKPPLSARPLHRKRPSALVKVMQGYNGAQTYDMGAHLAGRDPCGDAQAAWSQAQAAEAYLSIQRKQQREQDGAVPVYVMLPLDTVSGRGGIQGWQAGGASKRAVAVPPTAAPLTHAAVLRRRRRALYPSHNPPTHPPPPADQRRGRLPLPRLAPRRAAAARPLGRPRRRRRRLVGRGGALAAVLQLERLPAAARGAAADGAAAAGGAVVPRVRRQRG